MALKSWAALWLGLVAASVVLAIGYGGHLLLLSVDEAAVPSEETLAFPPGSRVTGAARECGSGGCWISYTVVPASTAMESFAEEFPVGESHRPGNFWDPRSIALAVASRGNAYVVTASY